MASQLGNGAIAGSMNNVTGVSPPPPQAVASRAIAVVAAMPAATRRNLRGAAVRRSLGDIAMVRSFSLVRLRASVRESEMLPVGVQLVVLVAFWGLTAVAAARLRWTRRSCWARRSQSNRLGPTTEMISRLPVTMIRTTSEIRCSRSA